VEIIHANRREELPVRGDRARRLHEIFGIDEACLEAWFASRRAR
jgi:hypothetical protein